MAISKLSNFTSPTPPLLLLLIIIISFPLLLTAKTGGAATVHEVLRDYGLPGGLLPSSVKSFVLNNTSGLLEARLDGPCYAWYDNGLAYFEPIVRGNLSYGALSGVVGLAQEELFLWLPVKGILVAKKSAGVILFDIGVAHKRLPASDFEDPPVCRAESGAVAGRDRGGPQGTWKGLQNER